MSCSTDKITDFFIKNDKIIFPIIIIILAALFLINVHSKKSPTNFKCSNSTCTIKKFNNKGILKSVYTIPTNYCKSFYVAKNCLYQKQYINTSYYQTVLKEVTLDAKKQKYIYIL